MTVEELKSLVKKRFKVGQTITIPVSIDKRKKSTNDVVAKIKKFYPYFVLVEREGYTEGFTYWDVLHAKKGRKKDIIIPEIIKAKKRIV